MRRNGFCIPIILLFLLLVAACTSPPEPAAADRPPAKDAPAGTWTGEYGSSADRRDPVSVDLEWADGKLRGEVHSGPRSMPLTSASFKPESGEIHLEFDAQGNGGQTVHYQVEGKVEGDTMTGKFVHDGQRGDFLLKRE